MTVPDRGRAHGGPPPRLQFRYRRIVALVGVVLAIVGGIIGVRALVGVVTAAPESTIRRLPPSPSVGPSGQIPDCAADNLAVSVDLARTKYVVGEPVPMTITVEHRGRTCLLDGSDAGRQVVITSGQDLIWSSAHCASGDRPLLLSTDDVDTSQVVWPGIRSAAQCPQGLAQLRPGTYVVTVVVPGAEAASSEPVTLTLVAPPAPEPPAPQPVPSSTEPPPAVENPEEPAPSPNES